MISFVRSRPEDLDEFTPCVTDRAGRQVAAAFEAANLVPARCGAAVDLVFEANDARFSIPAAALRPTGPSASYRNPVVDDERLVYTQAAWLGDFVEASRVPAGGDR